MKKYIGRKRVISRKYPKSISKRVRKIEKKIKKIEFKAIDNEGVIAPSDLLSTTTNVNHITVIPAGDTSATRDGKEVILRSIKVKGTITSSASTDHGLVRIIIFWMRDTNSVLPPPTSVLGNAYTVKWLAQRERDFINDIVVKYDKTFVLDAKITATSQVRTFQYYKKLNHKCSFTKISTTGTIGSSKDGHWFIMAIGDNATAAYNPQVDWTARVYFQE